MRTKLLFAAIVSLVLTLLALRSGEVWGEGIGVAPTATAVPTEAIEKEGLPSVQFSESSFVVREGAVRADGVSSQSKEGFRLSGRLGRFASSLRRAMRSVAVKEWAGCCSALPPQYLFDSVATITVTLSATSSQTVTVDYATGGGTATAGVDYPFTRGRLTFAPGQTGKSFQIPIVDDALDEPDEGVVLALGNPDKARLGERSEAALTIIDYLPRVRFSSSAFEVEEGAGSALITATLNVAPEKTVKVNCNIRGNTLLSSTLVFTGGQTVCNLEVPISDDLTGDAGETVLLTLSNPENAALGSPGAASLTFVSAPLPTATRVPVTRRVPTATPTVTPTPDPCQPIAGESYGRMSALSARTDRPAAIHPDLNLTLRGYEPFTAERKLIYYTDSGGDTRAPQLFGLFADNRLPVFSGVYRVNDWDWKRNSRGGVIANWDATLVGVATTPGETLHVPDSGREIGRGYEALVLYADPERITLKYTPDDNVEKGYTIHVENICVDQNLLALYQALDKARRVELPALRARQPFGRARGSETLVAIRDSGSFMDPRSHNDWWRGR